MNGLLTLKLCKTEIDTILNALQIQIHSNVEFMNDNNYALNPASEEFQTFLSEIIDMNDIYLKLSAAISEEETEE